MLRFKTKGKIFDVAITAVAGMLSVQHPEIPLE